MIAGLMSGKPMQVYLEYFCSVGLTTLQVYLESESWSKTV